MELHKWSYINSKVTNYTQIGDLINTKNDSTTNEDKVDILSKYFSSVFMNES